MTNKEISEKIQQDDSDWAEEISDVEPLVNNTYQKDIGKTFNIYKKRQKDRQKIEENHQNQSLFSKEMMGSMHHVQGFDYQTTSPFVKKVYKESLFCAARASVSAKIFQKLKKGEIPYHAVLDLHGLKEQDAYLALSHFIQVSVKQGLKCVLVVHGKGRQQDAQSMGLIKTRTPEWLEQQAYVLAYHTTQPRHGGSGAVYVLLRKESV